MGNLGNRLRDLREESKLSQLELADKIGTKQSRISRFETGDETPETDTLIKFADFFNVSIDYLLSRTNDKLLHQLYHVSEGEYEFISVIIGALVQTIESKDPMEIISICKELAAKDCITDSRKAILKGISMAIAGLVKGKLDEKQAQVNEVMKQLEEKRKPPTR